MSDLQGDKRSAVAVFTAKSVATILHDGGSCSWVLDPVRARQCGYLVCTRNGHPDEWAWAERAPEPHRSAFLVGTIADAVPSPNHDGRWLIRIDRYALVERPELWQGWRNPVRYTTLDELGIDPAGLEFEDMPPVGEETIEDRPFGRPAAPQPGKAVPHLGIAEAKRGLAATFGVPEEAIEITIRA